MTNTGSAMVLALFAVPTQALLLSPSFPAARGSAGSYHSHPYYPRMCVAPPSDIDNVVPLSEIDDESFETAVLDRSLSQPVLVAFSATWCGPCRMIEPMLKNLNAEGCVEVVKVNLHRNSKVIQAWLATKNTQVAALPTCILLRRGEVVGTMVGRFDRAALTGLL